MTLNGKSDNCNFVASLHRNCRKNKKKIRTFCNLRNQQFSNHSAGQVTQTGSSMKRPKYCLRTKKLLAFSILNFTTSLMLTWLI